MLGASRANEVYRMMAAPRPTVLHTSLAKLYRLGDAGAAGLCFA